MAINLNDTSYLYYIVMLIRYVGNLSTLVINYAQHQRANSSLAVWWSIARLKLKLKRRFWQKAGQNLNVSALWECCVQITQEILTFQLIEDINYALQKTCSVKDTEHVSANIKLKKITRLFKSQSCLEKTCFSFPLKFTERSCLRTFIIGSAFCTN